MSTLSVYGDSIDNSKPYNEFSECHPSNAYGKSKLEAEKELRRLNDENFCVSIIRTPLVYGKNVKANMQSLIKLVKKIPVLPFKNVPNKRSFTAIENLIEYIDLVIEYNKAGTYIATDLKPSSTTELIKQIAKSLNKSVVLFKLPAFALIIAQKIKPDIIDKLYGSFVVENNFTVKQLNYKEKISTEEAIYKMINSKY